MSRAVVISDTDVLGHIINGGIFDVLVPHVIEEIYITPQVKLELERNRIHYQVFHLHNQEKRIKLTKDEWSNLSPESRQKINQVRRELRAVLDPGELDCYAYSVGMGIDAIISNDGDAREKITSDSGNQKIVMNFAQLLLLGVKSDKFDIAKARECYDKVIQKNNLSRFASFEAQVQFFDKYTLHHPWIQDYLNYSEHYS